MAHYLGGTTCRPRDQEKLFPYQSSRARRVARYDHGPGRECPMGYFEQHRTSVGDMLNQCIKRGMEGNWCQVWYAASIAARTFLLKLQPVGRAAYMPTLLPRLCLNLYYIAERVQKYSQESWQLIVGTHGRDLVTTYATDFVDYYVEMENHCARESACHCIAELGTKVDASAIRLHVPRLLQALLLCFYDVSNLVRDAACLASAQLVLGFPDEARPFLEEFYRLCIEHLSDPIWSVREDAAVALGNVIRAYGQEALLRVVAVTTEYLRRAKTQPAMTQHENDETMRAAKHHMSKQAFSCCPKCVPRPGKASVQTARGSGTHRRAIFAACDGVPQLCAQIGPSIFRGRVDANTDVDGLLNSRENLDDGAEKTGTRKIQTGRPPLS
ncbi:hypothetical protein PsorP6_014310 [Peronosclerospora sorghi]|uniref:Uncharacterized protein n=1 Tax=Peronosclerospora sorghi TaxID=230839 RepID=A0ACC0VHY6_9STRA|nr:hypothetical protein PsorP6_014310 [Peronosclerospora sorghi]